MGRGNYLPNDCNDIDYEMVYVDLDPEYNLDEFDYEWAYRDLKECIAKLVPSSFWYALYWDSAGYGRDEYVLVAGNLLEVRLADNQWSTAVIVRPSAYMLERFPEQIGLAYRHLPNVARKLFAGLHELGFALYERSCAWTSRPYDPRHRQAA